MCIFIYVYMYICLYVYMFICSMLAKILLKCKRLALPCSVFFRWFGSKVISCWTKLAFLYHL